MASAAARLCSECGKGHDQENVHETDSYRTCQRPAPTPTISSSNWDSRWRATGEIADRVAAQLGRSEEERAFDLDEYWAAVNGVGEMARQTLELVLTDDEKFGDFLEKATQSGAYRPSDDDGQVH